MKKTINIFLLILLSLSLTACDWFKKDIEKQITDETIVVESITAPQNEIFMALGDAKNLTIEIKPENASDKVLKYKSSNEDIVKVDNDGKVTAIAEGSANITVSSNNGKTTVVMVTVTKPVEVESLEAVEKEISLEIGSYKSLQINILPNNATNKTLIYESSNELVATVDNTGKVTAVAVGTANITVSSSNGKTAVVKVTVIKPVEVESLEAVEKEISLELGSYKSLQINILPNNAVDKTLKYESSNELIATVDNTGKAVAKAEGVADIKVSSSNGKTTVVKVTVTKPVENKVTVNVNGMEVNVNIKNLKKNIETLYIQYGDGYIIYNNNGSYGSSGYGLIMKDSPTIYLDNPENYTSNGVLTLFHSYRKATTYTITLLFKYNDDSTEQKIVTVTTKNESVENAPQLMISDTTVSKNEAGEVILSAKDFQNVAAIEMEIDYACWRGLSLGATNSDIIFLTPLANSLQIISRPYCSKVKISIAGIKDSENFNNQLIKFKLKGTSVENFWACINSVKVLDKNMQEIQGIKLINGLIRVTEEGN